VAGSSPDEEEDKSALENLSTIPKEKDERQKEENEG